MSSSDTSPDWLPLVRMDGRRLTLKEVEASAIDHAMLTCRSLTAAARELGIGRATLYRKLGGLSRRLSAGTVGNLIEAPRHAN